MVLTSVNATGHNDISVVSPFISYNIDVGHCNQGFTSSSIVNVSGASLDHALCCTVNDSLDIDHDVVILSASVGFSTCIASFDKLSSELTQVAAVPCYNSHVEDDGLGFMSIASLSVQLVSFHIIDSKSSIRAHVAIADVDLVDVSQQVSAAEYLLFVEAYSLTCQRLGHSSLGYDEMTVKSNHDINAAGCKGFTSGVGIIVLVAHLDTHFDSEFVQVQLHWCTIHADFDHTYYADIADVGSGRSLFNVALADRFDDLITHAVANQAVRDASLVTQDVLHSVSSGWINDFDYLRNCCPLLLFGCVILINLY